MKPNMLGFLHSQYRPLGRLLPEYRGTPNQRPTGVLSHDKAENLIGFDYTLTDGPEWAYITSLLAWIALCIGRAESGRLYIRYDGATDVTERWPIYTEGHHPDGIVVGPNGFRPFDPTRNLPNGILKSLLKPLSKCRTARINEAIRAEIERLDRAWKRENPRP